MAILKNQARETFVQGLAQGKTQREAYLEAYPNAQRWAISSVDVNASKLAKEEDILERLRELQSVAVSAAIMSREERMLTLSDIALDPNMPPKSRMQAIDILNKMDGDYVKKVEATITRPTDAVAHEIEAILDE